MESRKFILSLSEKEARDWIYEADINSDEFIRRYNVVYFDYGLSRSGIAINDTITSGETIMEYDGE